MKRQPIEELDDRKFDVAVIGAGVNGSSAAQHLAAAGYSVLVIDRNDFGSGSSSRSTRMMHCGLRYLAPGSSIWEFFRHPRRLTNALRMARLAMESRAQFVEKTPERAIATKWFYPIYRDGAYARWQVALAFGLLQALGPKSVPLGYRRLTATDALKIPLVKWLRNPGSLSGVMEYREYLYDWPERICVDTIIDAQRLGAVPRNYTELEGQTRDGEDWNLVLRETIPPFGRASVAVKVILNTAGIWVDEVNSRSAITTKPGRKITGTKGVHIMVQFPDECRDHGMTVIDRTNQPINFTPWRGMHYIGPTETLYEGDINDIKPLESEINWLIEETNFILSGKSKLKRSDVLFAWAGVRPLTYDASLPKGNRSRQIHTLEREGMPNVFALTGGPIMTHRSAGAELTSIVAKHLASSGVAKPISFQSVPYPKEQNSPPLLNDYTSVKLSDLRYAAENEQVTNLVDLLFRRVGAGWTKTMAASEAKRAAETVADILGWDDERIEREVSNYRSYLLKQHCLSASAE